MANLNDIAGDVGLQTIQCQCGQKIDGTKALESMFNRIIAICRSGGEVRIKNFGIFKAKVLKGRKVRSPVLDEGQARFEDALVLRFHQSSGGKEKLNKSLKAKASKPKKSSQEGGKNAKSKNRDTPNAP